MNQFCKQRHRNPIVASFVMLAMASFAMFYAPSVHASVCKFQPGKSTASITFTTPWDLNVPRNLEVGGVVWESEPLRLSDPNNDFICIGPAKWGLINSIGSTASASSKTSLPIGRTGLAWSVHYKGQYRDYGLVEDISHAPLTLLSQTVFSFFGSKFTLRIIKIGAVTAGASMQSGPVGYVSINNDINAFIINTSRTISVSTLSCKTPDVTVRMGDKNRVSAFKGVGQSLAPVNFSIGLKECPEGINKVSYELRPNTTIVDAARSVVALDNGSTAKGVGLQLLDNTGNPVALNKTIVFTEYDNAGGNFNIPLKAAYHQTGAVVQPGTANSSVTFLMSYE